MSAREAGRRERLWLWWAVPMLLVVAVAVWLLMTGQQPDGNFTYRLD